MPRPPHDFPRTVMHQPAQFDHYAYAAVVCYHYVTECYDRSLPGFTAPSGHHAEGQWIPDPGIHGGPNYQTESTKFGQRIFYELGFHDKNGPALSHHREVRDYSFERLTEEVDRLTKAGHIVCHRPVKKLK